MPRSWGCCQLHGALADGDPREGAARGRGSGSGPWCRGRTPGLAAGSPAAAEGRAAAGTGPTLAPPPPWRAAPITPPAQLPQMRGHVQNRAWLLGQAGRGETAALPAGGPHPGLYPGERLEEAGAQALAHTEGGTEPSQKVRAPNRHSLLRTRERPQLEDRSGCSVGGLGQELRTAGGFCLFGAFSCVRVAFS